MLVNIKRTTDLTKIKTDIVVGSKFSVRNDIFSTNEINDIIETYNHDVYVNVDMIIHEDMLEELKELLSSIADSVAGIYFSDFAVFEIAKNLGIVNKLVYNTGTLSTNYHDVQELLDNGIKRVCLARELTLAEIQYIQENVDCNRIEVLIHGKINMFYSKRQLLTNYYLYRGIDKQYDDMNLVEQQRDDKLSIVEDESGTNIYNYGFLCSYDEIESIKALKRIDSYFLSDDELLKEIDIYTKLLDGQEVAFDKEGKNSGFYYKATVYNKK